MWPLRVGPINTLNGMRDTEPAASGDKGNKGKKLFDNTLVMSFVEHTIVLTLTGEEVSKTKFMFGYIQCFNLYVKACLQYS